MPVLNSAKVTDQVIHDHLAGKLTAGVDPLLIDETVGFWHDLGFSTLPQVRDLWRRQELGGQKNFIAELSPRGCALLQATPPLLPPRLTAKGKFEPTRGIFGIFS